MENKKSEVIQIRVSKLEKQVIKDKASLLGISVTDYIINCCVFSSVSGELVLLKQNIETSGGDSTPPEAKASISHL
ncbi:hypothetical protein CLTEP_26900 [Clostridium tepidiprofundi DSM 19306]|uniref:Uncharacterized protein n=1 Tax=Clostridium tepidiprofundi DSM 19306 TaxID=1121338 RepID=A0A151AQX6_9CLOT|nr:hypothetical protein [Clostridium tepidiprofundi]KYH30049.1 hypothetical protein CLTEP_26900 [Clostridium tepidiprofundi DSM 19306]